MDKVMEPQIIAVVCTTEEPAVHITDVNLPLSEVKQRDAWIEVGNLAFPYHWYQTMELCDENTLNDVKKTFKL